MESHNTPIDGIRYLATKTGLYTTFNINEIKIVNKNMDIPIKMYI